MNDYFCKIFSGMSAQRLALDAMDESVNSPSKREKPNAEQKFKIVPRTHRSTARLVGRFAACD